MTQMEPRKFVARALVEIVVVETEEEVADLLKTLTELTPTPSPELSTPRI
jgi:hypothetical protein